MLKAHVDFWPYLSSIIKDITHTHTTLTPTQTCNIIFFLDGADNPGGAKAETHTVTAGPGGTIILNLTGVD